MGETGLRGRRVQFATLVGFTHESMLASVSRANHHRTRKRRRNSWFKFVNYYFFFSTEKKEDRRLANRPVPPLLTVAVLYMYILSSDWAKILGCCRKRRESSSIRDSGGKETCNCGQRWLRDILGFGRKRGSPYRSPP